jgi:hypothetical protein
MTWITQEKSNTFEPYFELSEGASEPNELELESLF